MANYDALLDCHFTDVRSNKSTIYKHEQCKHINY